jgi:murein L,D-transpeptidase YcbB/YkuD
MNTRILIYFLFVVALIAVGCNEVSQKPQPKKTEIVKEPEKFEPAVTRQLTELLDLAVSNNGQAGDISLNNPAALASIYLTNDFTREWSKDKRWHPIADSVFKMILRAEYYGLFPEDYHASRIDAILRKLSDSAAKNDAALWARGDLLLSDALVSMSRHLKLGRIPRDSVSLRKDSTVSQEFYNDIFAKVRNGEQPREILEALEPAHQGYHSLKALLPAFLDSLERKEYTYIEFPFTDSMVFVKQLQTRMYEDSFITFNDRVPDSVEFAAAVKKVQVSRKLKVDGKAGQQVVSSLNNTSLEKFRRIAINLDGYKHLPDSMPASYIWVNLPAFKMEVVDSGQVVLESKVIIGQPRTRTPLLTSQISNFITFPQWTVPYSIIFKEMLPKIQKDVNYLAKENLMVVDKNDSVIDPRSIDWSKLSKTKFPYLLRQRQGDDNSLGVMKFNFRNKYDVYLHDTNARSLFSRPNRALSHGCVRVQEWDSLSRYLIAKDTNNIPIDTVRAWLTRQEKHTVALKQKVPVYVRYFTCEPTEEGYIRFYEDIYGEDKTLRMKYFVKN